MTKTIRYNPRRSGKTTLAMLNAPPNSIYVWVNEQLAYPQALARDLGRGDLKIVGPRFLRPGDIPSQKWVTVDHATRLSIETHAWLDNHNHWVNVVEDLHAENESAEKNWGQIVEDFLKTGDPK